MHSGLTHVDRLKMRITFLHDFVKIRPNLVYKLSQKKDRAH